MISRNLHGREVDCTQFFHSPVSKRSSDEVRGLVRDRVRRRLQEKPFQILATLLEHSGEMVTESSCAGWDDQTRQSNR